MQAHALLCCGLTWQQLSITRLFARSPPLDGMRERTEKEAK